MIYKNLDETATISLSLGTLDFDSIDSRLTAFLIMG